MLVQTALNAVDLTKLTSSSGPSVTVLQASPRPLPAQRAQQNNINAQQAAYGQPPQSQPGRQGCPGAGSPNAEANAKISSRADDLVFGTIIVVSISAPQVLGIGAISQPA